MKNQKILAFVLAITMSGILPVGFAGAATWTNQLDYLPGSVVTISGDNSDNAGWISNEIVSINVTTPYGSEHGETIVGEDGSFSWQFTLPNDDSAVGDYAYTVTGQTSGVLQNATFTDACPVTSPACAPSGLIISGSTSVSISLSWVDHSTNESEFHVERSTDNVVFSEIATPAGTSYTNSGLSCGQTFYYRVRAHKHAPGAGFSAYSNTVSGSTIACPDTTAPVIVPTAIPEPNEAGWNNTDVTVSWSVTDDESAISSSDGCDEVTLTDETDGTVLTCTATSDGGTASKSVTVKIDKTKPIITGTPLPSANGAGWNKTDVEVSFLCAETGTVQSGIVTNTVAGETLTTEGAGQSVTNTGSCVDAAGNEADSATVSDINIDKTAPEVVITTPEDGGSYTFKQTILADWSATDALSGIDTKVGTVPSGTPIDTSSLGTKEFTVTATDLAGNSSEIIVSYDVVPYTFGGFGSPLTISSKEFKKMSTIPVKFQLFDTLGNPVSNAVGTLKVNGVPAVSSGGSNVGNYFRYDPTGKQYIFNLSTKPLTLGTNILVATLDDGTTHSWTITIK